MNTDMQKNIVIAILSVVCVILGIMLVSQNISSIPVTGGTPQDTTGSAQSLSTETIFSRIPAKYSQNENFQACVARSTDSCIDEASFTEGEESVCSDYVTQENRDQCEQMKITESALAANDSTTCNEISSDIPRNNCLYKVVVEKGRQSDFDTAVCSDLEDSLQSQCSNTLIREKALSTKNAKLCETLETSEEDTFEIDICKEEVKFSLEEEKLREEQEVEASKQN